MRINRHDTNGAKPLLGKGELGYDDYTAGGDIGRVYVGTSAENIALAKRLEANTMTKAQFNALAEERKANRAGSGFDEWGKHTGRTGIVNEGMMALNVSNTFALTDWSSSLGSSKTLNPQTNINGVRTTVKSVNNNANGNYIVLPTAPNIYPYDTVLTAEQIASGVIKHADASNSGLIVNGKFDTDTSGWTGLSSSLVIESGKLKITNTTSTNGASRQSFSSIIGKEYIVEFEVTSGSHNLGMQIKGDAAGITGWSVAEATTGRYTFKYTATTTTTYLLFAVYNNSLGAYAYVDNIAVYLADAISRQDFVFIKQNIENIATKDFFVPLGNKQYLGVDVDGITGISVAAFSGATTSSLFGTWQVADALVGKGYVWSTRTEAQKKALLANPGNNAYLDGADIYQATYMIKVTNLPNDNYTESTAFAYVGYTQDSVDKGLWTHSDGSKAVPVALVHRRNQGMYHPVYNANGSKKASDGNFWYNTAVSFTSILDCFDPAKLLTASGYIGSVSGRPDGLFYDQVHESDITDLRNSSKKVGDYNRLISREFNKLVAGTYRGKEGEKSFKPLTFTNCGFVQYASPNGTRQTYRLLSSSSFMPKWHSYWGTSVYGSITQLFGGIVPTTPFAIILAKKDGINYFIELSPSSSYTDLVMFRTLNGTPTLPNVGSLVELVFDEITWLWLPSAYEYMGTSYGHKNSVISTRTKSNTLLHCDIIGNPTNYPTAWKESGVFGTPLIVAEDGTSLLPNGILDTFKLSRKANTAPLLCLRSTDNGATWTSFTPTFSIRTNAITLTGEPAGNLVVVYYRTHTSMAVPVTNSEVLEIGDVFATTHYVGTYGGYLSNTLISKSPTSSGTTRRFNYYKLNNCPMQPIPIRVFMTGTGVEPPSHIDANLLYIDNTPAIKVFPYLTRLNGKAYLNLVFKEMKYGSYLAPTVVTASSATYTQNLTYKINIAGCALDGKVIKWIGTTTTSAIDWSLYDVSPTGVIYLLSTGVVYTNAKLYDGDSWGDSNKFEIVDNVSTTTDDNGQTVLIGQKTVELPYFIGADE